jgi:hypothetical protein
MESKYLESFVMAEIMDFFVKRTKAKALEWIFVAGCAVREC